MKAHLVLQISILRVDLSNLLVFLKVLVLQKMLLKLHFVLTTIPLFAFNEAVPSNLTKALLNLKAKSFKFLRIVLLDNQVHLVLLPDLYQNINKKLQELFVDKLYLVVLKYD